MSTKYTREQIDKARQLADHAFRETAHRNRQDDGDIVAGTMRRPGDEWIDVFTETLGLDVEPEKPEPGTWHIVAKGPRKGYRAVVQQSGVLVMFNDHGDGYRRAPEQDWPALTPARVVPAEPVELSEPEVGELFDTARGDDGLSWDSWTDTAQGIITATVNAALAKHGH